MRPLVFAIALGLTTALPGCATSSSGQATQVAPVPESLASQQVHAELIEADIATLQARMAANTLTSEALTQAYLQRIAAVDKAGPRLNAVIELNPQALEEARARDAERAAGQVRGALHGVPVLLKDNIDARPMVNSAGSLALSEHRPSTDAFIVQRLREAGAVILGKTNLSEWANFRSTRSTSGWSSRGGQTRNPYVLDRSPCGSSSGTSSAVAASLATVGIGTETSGSLLCPAAVSALVGFKPTVGMVSRHGIIPIGSSHDSAGPMTRTVADAAVLMDVLAASDVRDAASTDPARPAQVAFTQHLSSTALRGVRLGVLRENQGKQPDTDAVFEQALASLRQAGAQLVDVEIPTAGQFSQAQFTVLLYEFKHELNAYLRDSGAPVASLEALIAYNREHRQRLMPWFEQELLEAAQSMGELSDAAYTDARAQLRRLAREQGLDATLAEHQLDALITATTGPAWMVDPVNGDNFGFAGYTLAAAAGTPSLTVPMGEVHGLPVGLTFMGAAWADAKLLGLGYAFEQATHARKAPQYLPTLQATP